MDGLKLVKNYRDDKQLRNSFNQLAMDTFGIEFETWYRHGYWTEKYQPYSFIDHGRVAANVSVNLMDLVINGVKSKAIQIGTVMTHPDYRNKGLSRKLMEIVLEDFKEADVFYLFANQSVLEYYPKFDFYSMEEVQFSMEFDGALVAAHSNIRKLDGRQKEDLAFIYSLAANRMPVSKVFATAGTEELLMFYCSMVFSHALYYLEKEKALVIFEKDEDTLHLYDIVSQEDIDILTIIRRIAASSTKKVVFHFHPDDRKLPLVKEPYRSDTVLFIKNMRDVKWTNELRHPLISQA
jgi:GNAT superfamily N-acetyltransferase